MATALNLIQGALGEINEYAPGETLDDSDANDALFWLNDLMDSLSNEHLACYNRVENIFDWTSGQNIYTVGNPVGGTFLGTTVQGSETISGVTAMPSNVQVGGTITGAGIASGATVSAIGTNTITMSAPATGTFSVLSQYTFTTPGNINIQRPLRIINGFTRLTSNGISNVDYALDIISVDQWSAIGLKNQPGPWPKVLYYDAAFPLATMYIFPNPSQGGEAHIWTDNLFTDFLTLDTAVTLPQGYNRFLKLALAIEAWPHYKGSAPIPQSIMWKYTQAKTAVKNLNAQAQSVATYDHAIAGRSKNDAGWILHGGFN